jgi:hypothetical protein
VTSTTRSPHRFYGTVLDDDRSGRGKSAAGGRGLADKGGVAALNHSSCVGCDRTKVKVESEEGEDGTIEAIRGFRAVYVFDISQTEGDDIPDPDAVRPKLLDGDARKVLGTRPSPDERSRKSNPRTGAPPLWLR